MAEDRDLRAAGCMVDRESCGKTTQCTSTVSHSGMKSTVRLPVFAPSRTMAAHEGLILGRGVRTDWLACGLFGLGPPFRSAYYPSEGGEEAGGTGR